MKSSFPWKRALASIPSGLSYTEAARRLGQPYQQCRQAIKRHRYRVADGRKFSQNGSRKIRAEEIDWRKSNIQIARELLAVKGKWQIDDPTRLWPITLSTDPSSLKAPIWVWGDLKLAEEICKRLNRSRKRKNRNYENAH